MVVACPVVCASRHPSELELISSYLLPRITSGDKSCHFIHHADVYTADPTYLTSKFVPALAGDGEKVWYFFSPVRTKSVRGQRKARTVQSGEGCWHSEAGAKPVLDACGCRSVGHRQFFSFVKKEDGRRVRTGWLMVELGIDREQKENMPCELVLCKIYFTSRTPSSPGAKKSPTAVDYGHKRKDPGETNSDAARPVQVQRRCLCLPEAAASHSGTAHAAEEHSARGTQGSNERSENSMVISADARKEEVTQCGSKELSEKESMAETAHSAEEDEDTQGQSEELSEKGSIAETADAVEEDNTVHDQSKLLLEKGSMADEPYTPQGDEMADEPDTSQGDETGHLHRDITLMRLFDDGVHHPVTLPEALSEYCEAIAAAPMQRRQARLTPRSPASRPAHKTSPPPWAFGKELDRRAILTMDSMAVPTKCIAGTAPTLQLPRFVVPSLDDTMQQPPCCVLPSLDYSTQDVACTNCRGGCHVTRT